MVTKEGRGVQNIILHSFWVCWSLYCFKAMRKEAIAADMQDSLLLCLQQFPVCHSITLDAYLVKRSQLLLYTVLSTLPCWIAQVETLLLMSKLLLCICLVKFVAFIFVPWETMFTEEQHHLICCHSVTFFLHCCHCLRLIHRCHHHLQSTAELSCRSKNLLALTH